MGRKRAGKVMRRAARKKKAAQKQEPVVATVCSYGTGKNDVQYTSAVIHRGSKVLASRVYKSLNFESEDDLCQAMMSFIATQNVTQVRYVDDVCDVEYCGCGEMVVRITDGNGESRGVTDCKSRSDG